MKTNTIKPAAHVAEGDVFLGENWFDPLEAAVRTRVRGFTEDLLETELDAALARKRYERPSLSETEATAKAPEAAGHRHGHRERQLMGTFGPAIGRQDGRVEKCDHSGLPAAHQTGRRADRRRLSCGGQHAPGARGV